MRRRIVNFAILLFGFIFLFGGFFQLNQSFYSFKKLKVNSGVIESKNIQTIVIKKELENKLIIKLSNDAEEYCISNYIDYLYQNLNINDTVSLFTKPNISFFGNFVSSETGSRIWTSHDINEVFHLTRGKSNEILLDFSQHKRNLRKTAWVFPLVGILFFAWYLYRRSGIKHPLIIEYGG